MPCMPNSTTLGLTQRTTLADCECLRGFFEQQDEHSAPHVHCQLCERDSFCFEDNIFACPDNATAPRGAKSVESCVCDAGLQLVALEPQILGDAPDVVCSPCPATQVCHAGGEIELCAHNATNVNFHCVCAPGTYCEQASVSVNGLSTCQANTQCVPCPLT